MMTDCKIGTNDRNDLNLASDRKWYSQRRLEKLRATNCQFVNAAFIFPLAAYSAPAGTLREDQAQQA